MLGLLGSRLWRRLAATFVAASVLPILGAGFLGARLLEESVSEDAALRERAAADLAATLVRDFVARGHEKIKTVGRLLAQDLATHDAPTEEDRKAIIARLNHLVEPPDAYLELQFFARSGELVADAQQTAFSEEQVRQQAYAPGMGKGQQGQQRQQAERNERVSKGKIVRTPLESGEPFVGELEESFGFATLPISVAMKRGETPQGAVVAYLDLRRLSALLAAVAQSGCKVTLRDAAGKTLAEAGECPEPSLLQERPAGHAGWTVSAREPASRVYASLEAVRKQVETWCGVGALLAIALSVFIAARITGPIATLSRTAQRMEAGDLSARTRLAGEDEIGRLAQNFDRMAASLERLDDAKSDFVANVSHELRTPLTAIRLSIANLSDGVLGPVAEAQRETLARLRRDVDRMIRMVNDLLEMARLEAGAVVPKREWFDLAALAREVASALEPLAREKKLEVVVTGEGRAFADRSLIHRVASNLLDNAIKFTPQGGRVALAVGENELRVADTGPGLKNDRLFEKFSQAPVDGAKPRGTGLGLAIVKSLVALHGGSVRAEAREPGTCFVVKL